MDGVLGSRSLEKASSLCQIGSLGTQHGANLLGAGTRQGKSELVATGAKAERGGQRFLIEEGDQASKKQKDQKGPGRVPDPTRAKTVMSGGRSCVSGTATSGRSHALLAAEARGLLAWSATNGMQSCHNTASA